MPTHKTSQAEQYSQKAFAEGMDGAGVAYALRALEDADKQGTDKPLSFVEREMQRRRAAQERAKDPDKGGRSF